MLLGVHFSFSLSFWFAFLCSWFLVAYLGTSKVQVGGSLITRNFTRNYYVVLPSFIALHASIPPILLGFMRFLCFEVIADSNRGASKKRQHLEAKMQTTI